MPRPLSTPGKNPVPIVQEAGLAPGPVWTGAENLASTGFRSLYVAVTTLCLLVCHQMHSIDKTAQYAM
jgi:hypothetical protein